MKNIFLLTCSFLLVSSVHAQVNPCIPLSGNNDYKTTPTDTTITMQNGTEITLNRCEFFDIRECLDLREIRTLQDIQLNGLTTSDNFGNTLVTGGMLIFRISGPECPEKCLTVPARIRIPILSNCFPVRQNWGLYTADARGIWTKSGEPAKLITIGGTTFLEFYARCEGGFNCDQPMPGIKVKLKAKGIRSITGVQLSSVCPTLNLHAIPGRRKNIVRVKLFCQNADSLNVEGTGTSKSGQAIHFKRSLGQLKCKYTKSGCGPISKKIMRRVLGIFKLRERNIYRKYIIG